MNLRRNWLQFGRGSQFEQQNSPILFFCAVDTLSQIISIVSYQLWLYPESCFSFSYELHKVSASIGHIHDSCCLLAIMTQASLWFKCGNCSRSYKALEKASVVHTNAPEEDRRTKSKKALGNWPYLPNYLPIWIHSAGLKMFELALLAKVFNRINPDLQNLSPKSIISTLIHNDPEPKETPNPNEPFV